MLEHGNHGIMKIEDQIETILQKKEQATLSIQTLGFFEVRLNGKVIPDSAWKRDIAVQLFQFLISIRHQRALHKEQIIYRIWDNTSRDAGARNFKSALHSLTKAIEPDKPSRSPSEFIIRQGLSYRLNIEKIWIDIDALDELIVLGNQSLNEDKTLATRIYQEAVSLYQGVFLPNRIYEDWAAEERERIQVLILGAMMNLAQLYLEQNPQESIRLAQKALSIDNTWEEAYRLKMKAYMNTGNRPLAVKTYRQCKQILMKEFEIEPLPETKALFRTIGAM